MFKAALLFVFAQFISNIALAETKTYEITGMDCSGCVKAIKAKVCNLPGLTQCDVEVGKMTLTSENTLDSKEISARVTQAGEYSVKKESTLGTKSK